MGQKVDKQETSYQRLRSFVKGMRDSGSTPEQIARSLYSYFGVPHHYAAAAMLTVYDVEELSAKEVYATLNTVYYPDVWGLL